MLLRLASLFLAATVFSGAAGCVAETGDAPGEEPGAETDALTGAPFVRSDQVSFGRAPENTHDASSLVPDDFSDPKHAADEVIDWLKQHEGYPHPVYLGCVHTWIYDTDATYRANVHTLVATIHSATHHPTLLYFEEENASHAPHPLSKTHAHALRTLAGETSLLCATYANGHDDHTSVDEKVAHYKDWYSGELGVPMSSLMIDVDLSQTPSSFYYGSRGKLANFDKVVGWALTAAYDHGFAGFHTFGNVGGKYGTVRAADATYTHLDEDWDALVKAHPKREFAGL